ncbi:hypothetical protein MUK42_36462 [Musa troglodytarum]|uniref:Uncharacterized protein n=1 Tax=Musa troglodytarum TaxID=320322 RepID=A0A9E7GM97_9LILI|nr:hypothetical protein MUK42_36462 [Musa troglodytarum]
MQATLMLRQGSLDRKAMLNVEQNKKESFTRQKLHKDDAKERSFLSFFRRLQRAAATVVGLEEDDEVPRQKDPVLAAFPHCSLNDTVGGEKHSNCRLAEASGCLAADSPKVNGALFMETIIGDRSPFPFSILYQNMLLLLSFAK